MDGSSCRRIVLYTAHTRMDENQVSFRKHILGIYQVYSQHIHGKSIYLEYTWYIPGKTFLGIPDVCEATAMVMAPQQWTLHCCPPRIPPPPTDAALDGSFARYCASVPPLILTSAALDVAVAAPSEETADPSSQTRLPSGSSRATAAGLRQQGSSAASTSAPSPRGARAACAERRRCGAGR
jgi:hypothetical protein